MVWLRVIVIIIALLEVNTFAFMTTGSINETEDKEEGKPFCFKPLTSNSFKLVTVTTQNVRRPVCDIISGSHLVLYFEAERCIFNFSRSFRLELTNTRDNRTKQKDLQVIRDKRLGFLVVNMGIAEKRSKTYTMKIKNIENGDSWSYNSTITPASFFFYCFKHRNVTIKQPVKRFPTGFKVKWNFSESMNSLYKVRQTVTVGHGVHNNNQSIINAVKRKSITTKTYSRYCNKTDYHITCHFNQVGLEKCREYDVCVKVRFNMDGHKFATKKCVKLQKYAQCLGAIPDERRSLVLSTKQTVILCASLGLLVLAVISCRILSKHQEHVTVYLWENCAQKFSCFKLDYYSKTSRVRPRVQSRVRQPTLPYDENLYEFIPYDVVGPKTKQHSLGEEKEQQLFAGFHKQNGNQSTAAETKERYSISTTVTTITPISSGGSSRRSSSSDLDGEYI